MKRLILIAALPLLASCGDAESAKSTDATLTPVVANDVVCRPTPNGRKVTACYMTLVAPSDDTLESVASPAAARASIHETTMESNMMMMHPIEGGLPLTAGQAVAFTPGGNHIMLNDVAAHLVEGQTVQLTLTFAKAPDLTVTAAVGQPAVAEEG